jgi:hypothetical protein
MMGEAAEEHQASGPPALLRSEVHFEISSEACSKGADEEPDLQLTLLKVSFHGVLPVLELGGPGEGAGEADNTVSIDSDGDIVLKRPRKRPHDDVHTEGGRAAEEEQDEVRELE